MRLTSYIVLLFALSVPCFAQTRTVKVFIDAPELDAQTLMPKLVQHGADHGISFQRVNADYDYKIVFGTRQEQSQALLWGSGGSFNVSGAAAAVFDKDGKELFKFTRSNRGTDKGATNAVAKEIVKRLQEWWKIEAENRK